MSPAEGGTTEAAGNDEDGAGAAATAVAATTLTGAPVDPCGEHDDEGMPQPDADAHADAEPDADAAGPGDESAVATTGTESEAEAEAEAEASVAGADPHPLRAALLVTAVTTTGMLAFSVFFPLLDPWGLVNLSNCACYFQSGDIWAQVPAARYAAYGALGHVYAASPFFVSMPLYAIFLAPVIWVSDIFKLTESFPQALQRPSVWPFLVVYTVGITTFLFVYAARKLLTAAGATSRRALTQWCLVPLCMVPIAIYGHYDDGLATACVMLAAAEVVRGRWRRVGIALAVGASLKQIGFLAIPVLVMMAPPGKRLRTLATSLSLPAFFLGLAFLADFAHTSKSVLGGITVPWQGHPAFWLPSTNILQGGPFRLMLVPVVLAVAWWVRGRREPGLVIAALAVVFAARLPLESVTWSYYAVPALALAIVHERATTGGQRRSFGLGMVLLFYYLLHPGPFLWWMGAGALLVGIFAPAFMDVLRRQPGYPILWEQRLFGPSGHRFAPSS